MTRPAGFVEYFTALRCRIADAALGFGFVKSTYTSWYGIALNVGDTLLFGVGDGGNMYYNDTTGLSIRIVAGGSAASTPDSPFGYLCGLGYWQGEAAETEMAGLTSRIES